MGLAPTPVVCTPSTAHGPSRRAAFTLLAEHLHIVAISESQRADNPDIPYAGVVHNGIDLDGYPFREEKDDFLVYIGRANPDKGPTLAIEVARRVGLPLAMVIKRNEPFERAYWDEIVAPLLNDEVEVYEAIPHEQKADLLGRARAMVFPIQWPEPFGLVMAEARPVARQWWPARQAPPSSRGERRHRLPADSSTISCAVAALATARRPPAAPGWRELQRRRHGAGLRAAVRPPRRRPRSRLNPPCPGYPRPDFHYGRSANRMAGHGWGPAARN